MRLVPALTSVVTAVALVAVTVPVAHSAEPGVARPAGTAAAEAEAEPSTGRRSNTYLAVDGAGPDDVWAVGYSTTSSTAMTARHWNGKRWRFAELPGVESRSFLLDVVVISSDDVWAVGFVDLVQRYRNLVVHWDGKTWSEVPPPPSSEYRDLQSITALAADDIVASGRLCAGETCVSQTLHWDGREWRFVEDGPRALVQRVDGTPDDAWAIGNTAPARFGGDPSVRHWDGANWEKVKVPQPQEPDAVELVDVASPAAGTAWVVGEGFGAVRYVLRWTGSRLEHEVLPAVVRSATRIDAVSPDDAWIVGRAEPAGSPLTLHWDGSRWSEVPNPLDEFPQYKARLTDVTMIGPSDVWAVGSIDVDISDYQRRIAMHWDGTEWEVLDGSADHRAQG